MLINARSLVVSALLVAAVSLSLAACSKSVSVGEPAVPKEQVQTDAQTQLTKAVGQKLPPISCPDDLKAKLGEKMICTVTLSGKPYDVTVTVTSVNGTDVKYDVKVASTPRG